MGYNMKVIVDLDELQRIAGTLEMYADLLEYVDENDLDEVEGYADEIKQAADALRNIVFNAETVEGVKK